MLRSINGKQIHNKQTDLGTYTDCDTCLAFYISNKINENCEFTCSF